MWIIAANIKLKEKIIAKLRSPKPYPNVNFPIHNATQSEIPMISRQVLKILIDYDMMLKLHTMVRYWRSRLSWMFELPGY
jgi:hypothetical protein